MAALGHRSTQELLLSKDYNPRMRRGVAVSKSKKINWRVKVFLSSMNNFQGPRSNFEIGGGGHNTLFPTSSL